MKKRLLTLTLLLAAIVGSAGAEERETSTVDTWSRLYVAISRNKTDIQLTANVKYGEGDGSHANKSLPAIPEGQEISIDLNGHTIDGAGLVRIFDNQGTLTLTGKGTISNGYATDKGAAVLNTGTLIINDGVTISGNKAPKGAAIWQGGTLNISGQINIADNIQCGSTAKSNIYLPSGKTINVTGDITNSVIGVTMESADVFTTGLGTYLPELIDDKAAVVFPADNETAYITTVVDGEAQLTAYSNLEEYEVSSDKTLTAAIGNAAIKRIKLTELIKSYGKNRFEIPASRTLTIDLNGIDHRINILNNGILTVTNSSTERAQCCSITNADGGKLTVDGNIHFEEADYACLNNYGIVYLQGDITFNYWNGWAIHNYNSGTIYLTGKVTIYGKRTTGYEYGFDQSGRFEIYGQIVFEKSSMKIADGHYIHVFSDLSESLINLDGNDPKDIPDAPRVTIGLSKYAPELLSLSKLNKVFRSDNIGYVIRDGEVVACKLQKGQSFDALTKGPSYQLYNNVVTRLTANITLKDGEFFDGGSSDYEVFLDLNGYNITNGSIDISNIHLFNSGESDEDHGTISPGNNIHLDGPTMRVSGAGATIYDGVTFKDNQLKWYDSTNRKTTYPTGGAIYVGKAKTLKIVGDVAFINNRGLNGGAIYLEEYSELEISGNVTFKDNKATTGNGNNIYHSGRSLVITGNITPQKKGDFYVKDEKYSPFQFRSGQVDVCFSENEVKVTGEGKMAEYASSDDVPWQFAAETMKSLTFTAGPTSVGANSFKDFAALEEITLPSTLRYVASTAFVGCDKVTRLIFNLKNPSNLTWNNYEDSFWEEGADMSVYVDKNYLTDWKAKFPYWFFEDVSSLNLGEEEDPENAATAIRTVEATTAARPDARYWYTIGGQRLSGQPTKPGLYINNGKKVVIK